MSPSKISIIYKAVQENDVAQIAIHGAFWLRELLEHIWQLELSDKKNCQTCSKCKKNL